MPRRCVSGTAIDVVDEIGEADFHGRSRAADGANEQIHPAFCSANTCSALERIFDLALLARRIAPGAPLRLFAMDMADEAVLSYERLVGRRSVGRPYAARRIGFVEKSSRRRRPS